MEAKTKRELELEEFLRKTYWTLSTYRVCEASSADWAYKAAELQEKIDAILGEGPDVADAVGGTPGADAGTQQEVCGGAGGLGDTGA